LARNGLFARQQGFGVVAQIHHAAVTGDLLHGTGDDFPDLAAVGVHHLRPLGLAHLLHDDLLGGLRGDAPELDGLDRLLDDVADLGIRLALAGLLDSQLGRRIDQIIRIDHLPATEGFVVAVLAVDGDPQLDFFLIALLGGGGQSQLQRFENHTGRYALLVGYRLNHQQYFFTHVRLVFAIHWIRGIRALIKTGNDIGLVDRIDRQEEFVIIHQYHHILFLDPAQDALEIASTFKGHTQPDLHLFAGVGGKLLQREQRPVHARGRHFQGVLTTDRVFHIEHAAYLTADRFAVLDEYAVGMINIDSQQGVLALGEKFDAPEPIAQRFNYRSHYRLQLFQLARHREPPFFFS